MFIQFRTHLFLFFICCGRCNSMSAIFHCVAHVVHYVLSKPGQNEGLKGSSTRVHPSVFNALMFFSSGWILTNLLVTKGCSSIAKAVLTVI